MSARLERSVLDRKELASRVADLLGKNRVQVAAHRYTRPARGTYPHQWLWDSCFHAILYQQLGQHELAADELRAVFRAQQDRGLDRGRLPHMTLLGAAAADQDAEAEQAFTRDLALWGNPHASTITQPPIVAEAVMRLEDEGLWRELWPHLSAYYDWWLRRRDPDSQHLYAVWHIWECGADATPRGDAACARLLATGRRPQHLDKQTVNPTAKKSSELLQARFLMLEELQALDGAEARGELEERCAQRGRQRLLGLIGIDMQAYLMQNLLAMAHIGEQLREAAAAQRYRRAATAIAGAVNDKLWDEEAGFYFDRWGDARHRVPVWTTAPLVALYARELVPPKRAERLLRHLLDPERFWTRWPVPSVARNESSFRPDEYWRGSTWLSHNWFIVRGLIESADRFDDPRYLSPARTIAERSIELVRRVGFREYYRSGAMQPSEDAAAEPAGFGPESFGWSGLALELFDLLETRLLDVEAAP